ncbi:NAD(P)-binding protein [Lentithecium fluviatile CBS 122367]|uniref:NAD(P)-binding protein n=1 Tax=Lentithecium fluviatile CBS 122367 TaxID=1168545 RepID=A0A6G1J6W3_9PLEO|nr:NAD(P)-binding protein [Lentithecium fluviatile CBS 122367]
MQSTATSITLSTLRVTFSSAPSRKHRTSRPLPSDDARVSLTSTSPKEDYDTFNTNVFGLLNVSKAFLPYIRVAPGHCTIANFGSIASWSGGPGYALYCGTKWAVSGISEAMTAELAPLGIAVTVIEPGYFRTGFLNPTAKVVAQRSITEYDDTAVGHVRKLLDATDNKQPGDVIKGCRVIVDVLTKTGVAEGSEVPIRVALGSDSPPAIREKLVATEKLLKEWEAVTTGTDHEA